MSLSNLDCPVCRPELHDVCGCTVPRCGTDDEAHRQRRAELEQKRKAKLEAECDCKIPLLEGAGQHSPACAIFRDKR